MHVLIAPDKFKGTLTAAEVAAAISKGITSVIKDLEITTMPMADGGEGSLEVLQSNLSAQEVEVIVKDPLGRSITASYLLAGESAYIEMARASGLHLLSKDEQNPLYTTTYGTGELILDALTNGARQIYVFLGGSSTNDMGIGMAEALGYEFLDRDGDRVPPVGLSLDFIMDIKRVLKYDPEIIKFWAVSDVSNPLYGKDGATEVYARQKGADKYAKEILEKGVKKLARRCKSILGADVRRIEGAGAAGGLGGGIAAFLGGEITSGINFMMDATGCADILPHVDLVITGEGSVDSQTAYGKVVHGISQKATAADVPVMVLCGQCASQNRAKLIYDLTSFAGSKDLALSDASRQLELMSAKAFSEFLA